MHLLSCPAWVGWKNTGNLTKSSIKFPSTVLRSLSKPHCVLALKEGYLIHLLKQFLVQQAAAVKGPRVGHVMVVALWGVRCLICTHGARGRVRAYQVMHNLQCCN